ncbi:nucleolar protein dao-5-like [Pecten maximus]|uniref:nucleolar protein dao-5-like n=1 Tax=Pecten maximus TaxID=6579 RepID=UPI001458D46F|nr:nucleolar protein dao-5-like [Pecten maximus]
MLTGVLNILVQQANLASTICSELLNSTERKQAEPLSNDVTHIFQDSTSETLANNERSFGAKPSITKDITSKSRRDTVDPSSNACSSNTSAPSCSISEKDSAVKNNVRTESFFSEGAKVVGDSNMTISKCSGKSDKGKCSKELFVNHDNLDTKQQVVRKESQSQHSKETTFCVHQEKSVKTKDAGSSEKCNKNRHEQINDNPTHSFVHDKTLDIPCSEHEMERNNVTDVDKDSSTPGTSDLPIVGMQDNVNNVVIDNPLILSDMVLVRQKTPDLSSEGVQQASLGTQVTESELETTGNKLDKQNIKIPDNQLQDVVEEDKPCTKGTGQSIIHPDKIKDRDRETRNSTNKPKPPKEKRNLFDSLFQVEESVVESPCKYRKLQFGKVPQSRTEDSTHVDTPARDHGKSSIGTINTTSLSNQRCRDGAKSSRQVSGSTKKSKASHQVAVFNKRAEIVSVVSSSSTPTTESKMKTSASVKSSSKRSSSVPSAQHYKDRKDGSKSRSRYHSSCGISEKDSSITHRRSGSHHRNNGSHRNHPRSSDEKAVTGQKVQRSESVVVHGNKRDICIQTEAQVVNQTPSKSKEKRQVKKGDTMSQLHTATEDVHCYVKESITEEKTKKSIKMTNSKDENSVIEDQSISRNKGTEGHDVNGHFIDSQCPVEMQHRRHCPDKLPTGFLHEYLRLDSESTNSMIGKTCDAEAPSPIKSKIENCSEDLFVPVSCYSNHRTTSVLDVEEDAYLLTQQDEMYKQRSLARDEEIFRCLSFSDSDDDVPLAQIVESLRASQGKSSSTVDGVNEWEDDQLPNLSVPNTSKYWKQHSHRRSRCDRPDLKTYLEIRNALPDTPTDQCSETPEITWRNSLMPPPLEAVRRSKSREKSSQSTSTDSQASSATGTIPPRSEDVSGNQSSESAQESDPEHTNYCDGEGVNADSGERGGSSRKKKRHRRKKSDKPVVSSSSEECIPKGRKRGFQWRQECLRILDRVYNHEFSDPFRHEVKSKDTPDYYKIVKRGMCFDIIGYKLRCNIYEELRDFFLDVRLVFDNCRLYHKPESPIYQAGLVVKCFFRKVAKEILMPRTTARSRHPS